jgi:radical SAM superfamily enzyme YgiQ (UPF0313 family)
MELLILQFVRPRREPPPPEFSHSVGVLSALLKAEGFGVSLVALPGYRPELLHEAVIERRPRYVLCELAPYRVAAARRTLVAVAERYQLPAVVFGQYATCKPSRAISAPGVEALLLGEYELPAVQLLRALRDAGEISGIGSVWIHTATGLAKGPIAPVVADLDSLPFPDRDVFGYGRMVADTGEVHVKVCRGCPKWCSYCVNDWYMDLYDQPDRFTRRRSVGNVLDEITGLLARYDGAESVVFPDHAFAMDVEWLRAFARDYPRACALPYRCHVRLSRVNEQVVRLLASSNCRWVHTHIGAGSRFIRDEILSMHVSDEQIVAACQMLREVGLNVAAEVFVGSPYESEITVEETLDLLRRAEFDEVHPRVFYPTPGSRAAELCAENGWISGRGEANYWNQNSVLDMPSMPAEYIDAVARKLPSLLKRSATSTLHKLLNKVRRSRERSVRRLGAEKKPRS